MNRLTLKACIDTIERSIGNYESNWTALMDIYREFTTSEGDLEYASRHIIRFNDTTWGEFLTDYLLSKEDSEAELARFFELVFDPRMIREETQQKLSKELLPFLALDGYTLTIYEFPLPGKVGYMLHRVGQPIKLKVRPFSIIIGDLFKYQFPAGLPFSLRKPQVVFMPEQGSQGVYFEDEADIGVIRENVYPDLTFEKLTKCLQGMPITKIGLRSALEKLSQTECEKKFFANYALRFNIWLNKVPVLIPQVWIQWHSRTKPDLRAISSPYADNLYRVDFVAFWHQQRFAILVDDISHYAVKFGTRWEASEEAYSKRLKEDRKLRKEGWQVFRVTNWEVKNDHLLPEILNDLKDFIGFEETTAESMEEEIPF